jgi:hypothetical protein
MLVECGAGAYCCYYECLLEVFLLNHVGVIHRGRLLSCSVDAGTESVLDAQRPKSRGRDEG